MSRQSPTLLLAVFTVFLIAGCSSQPHYNDSRYDDRNYRSQRCDSCGTVENIQSVWVRDKEVGGGAVLGAIIGAVVGNQVGSGDGRKAATVAGAVAGGVIGHQVEKKNANDRRAYEFEIRLEDGRWARVTQFNHNDIRVGDRVIIRDRKVFRLN